MTASATRLDTGNEQARLAAIARYDVLDDDLPGELRDICVLAAQLVGVSTAAVNIIDERFQHQVVAVGFDPMICDRQDSMCYTTLRQGSDVTVPDARRDARYADSPWVDGRLGAVRFYSSTILKSPDGQPVGTLCVFDDQERTISADKEQGLRTLARQVVDVLELRARSRELERTVQELSRSQEELAAFAGQVSHDLKTPLTASLGFTELLQELPSVAADPVARSYLARCASSGRRMLSMVDDLLAYARVGGKLRTRVVSLDDVIAQVLEDLAAVTEGADIRWQGGDLLADPAQLRVLLQNLVGNACTYRASDRPCRIAVTVDNEDGGRTRLTVADNGPGIPASAREEALAPLSRLRSDVPGSGLGLATCVRIAAAHGGTLTLGDTPGGGLTVCVEFPR